ncbi:MAG: signal peptidase II [Clostridia bacterium]|nr:signal peptidase II [Clostridia bacterium]MBQ3867572.1 signal peptidase II [Clostridia bacterium]
MADNVNGGAGKKRADSLLFTVLIDILLFIGASAVIIGADQLTKQLVYKNIAYGSSKVLIPRLLELSHVHNTGAAWGMLSEHTGALSAVTLVACALLAFLLFQSRKMSFKISLMLVIGGAIGNLIDRISRGYVIDFIRVWIFKYEFPNFNVADSCITIGCVMMIVAVLISGRKEGDTLFFPGSPAGRLLGSGRKKTEEHAVIDHSAVEGAAEAPEAIESTVNEAAGGNDADGDD